MNILFQHLPRRSLTLGVVSAARPFLGLFVESAQAHKAELARAAHAGHMLALVDVFHKGQTHVTGAHLRHSDAVLEIARVNQWRVLQGLVGVLQGLVGAFDELTVAVGAINEAAALPFVQTVPAPILIGNIITPCLR